MNKIVFLCFLLIGSAFAGTIDQLSFTNISRSKDVYRKYISAEVKIPPVAIEGTGVNISPYLFYLQGASVSGSLANSGVSSLADTSIFRYQTLYSVPPSVSFVYVEGHANFDLSKMDIDFGVSAIATGFMPAYIVEYTEDNGVEGFQQGQDTVVGKIDLKYYSYTTTKTTKKIKNAKGEEFNVHYISSKSDNGLFTMDFTVPEQSVGVNGNPVGASQTKIDIGIYNYYDKNVNKKPAFCDIINISTLGSTIAGGATTIIGGIIGGGLPFSAQSATNINIPFCDVTTGPSDKKSKLALLSFVGSVKFKATDKSAPSVTVDIGKNFSITYDWIGKAKVNTAAGTNQNSKVHSNIGKTSESGSFSNDLKSLINNKDALFVTYSFEGERPNTVEWDPTLGASNYVAGEVDPPAPSTTGSATTTTTSAASTTSATASATGKTTTSGGATTSATTTSATTTDGEEQPNSSLRIISSFCLIVVLISLCLLF
ncbi:hypothetical protein ACTFIU_006171 [Dictyostelium citrinum]